MAEEDLQIGGLGPVRAQQRLADGKPVSVAGHPVQQALADQVSVLAENQVEEGA